MITLPAALTAAQRRADRQPYVELKAYERIAGANRLRWTRFYTGAEVDARHAAAVASDGALLRCQVAPNGAQYDLQFQRVPNPSQGSDFASWTTVLADVSGLAGTAIAVSDSTVIVFAVHGDERTILHRVSDDHGATFGAQGNVAIASADVAHLAASANPSGVVALFFAGGATVKVIKRTAGAWGASAAWTNVANSITGMAAFHSGDYDMVIAGTDAGGNAVVWTCVCGDGYSEPEGAWSPLAELMAASSGSDVTYAYVAAAMPDIFRCTFIEKYNGTNAYTHTLTTHGIGAADFVDSLWREAWPPEVSCDYGVALASSATTAWLTTPSGVWQATISVPPVDLTPDLLVLSSQVSTVDSGLTGSDVLVARVRNDLGQYLESGSGKGQAWLGCELALGLGYRTADGNQASRHLSFWVEEFDYEVSTSKANLVLYAIGPWRLLEKWKTRRQLTWTAGSKSVQQILSFLLSRAGFGLSPAGASADSATLSPAFTVSPGENGREAVVRLLALVPDTLRWQNSTAILAEKTAGEASAYAYGGAHVILQGRYRTKASQANRVQVYAKDAFGEALSWTEIELLLDRLAQIHDQKVSGGANAAARAASDLRKAFLDSRHDLFTAPTHCGLEIHDVVDLTDARAGLSAAKRRVRAIATRYAAKGAYEQEIGVGEV